MKRRAFAKRRDLNEPEIVKGLEGAGCSVFRLDKPADLLVGKGGRNYLLEVKNPGALRGKKQAVMLTEDEAEFHEAWRGQVQIVESLEDALRVVGIEIH